MAFSGIQISGGAPVSPDDTPLYIGTGNPSSISWVTTDANANHMMVELPTGDAIDVPVVLFGQGIRGNDLAVYNGYVETTVAIWSNTGSANPPRLEFRKSRGSAASPTVITSGDDLGRISAYGYSGADGYVESARIELDSEGTIATNRVGGVIRFRTATDAAPSVLATAITISSSQSVRLESSISLATSVVLRQSTNNYTFTWADPATARAISIIDPGGTDVFVWRDAAQTLTSKTLTAPTLNGTTTLGSTPILTAASDLLIRTTAAGSDIEIRPNRALAFGALGATRVAVADQVSLFAVDIAAGDARLGFQSEAGGIIYIGNNAIRGTSLALQEGATVRYSQDTTGIGFFAVTPVARQTSGANLTNNVTAGGTNDTIADYTDLTIYANDAAAIRNDIYQLARKLKQVNDGLRSYGLLT